MEAVYENYNVIIKDLQRSLLKYVKPLSLVLGNKKYLIRIFSADLSDWFGRNVLF